MRYVRAGEIKGWEAAYKAPSANTPIIPAFCPVERARRDTWCTGRAQIAKSVKMFTIE
jgi:hypothetical protein